MRIPENFMEEIRRASNEKFNQAKEEYNLISIDQLLSIKIESAVLAALVGYHQLLREELLQQGIDIGEFDEPNED